MDMRRKGWSVIVLMGALLPGLAPAEPSVGQPLPPFVGTDLTGSERRSSELGGQPSVLIAATSRAASGETSGQSSVCSE